MDYALSSIIGKRDNQEDYGVITVSTPTGSVLAVIADGMGGQVAGEVASSSVVKGFVESFSSNNSKNLPLKLNVALDKANRTLAKNIWTNHNHKGMGATLIAAHINSYFLSWVSVGDSILYLYRDKKLYRLNDDHSMLPVIEDSVRRGKITLDEARVHPHRNALRSALTGEEVSLVDLREEPYRLKKNDLILLATDGILTLSETEISKTLERCKVQSAKYIADQLLSVVTYKNRARQDNTLVEVIKVSGSKRKILKRSAIVFPLVLFFIVVFSASIYHLKEDLFVKAFWFESSKQDALLPVTPGSDIKVTPISIKDSQQKPDKKYVAQPVILEHASKVLSLEAGPSTKNKNKNAIGNGSVPSAKTSKTIESEGMLKIDSPVSVVNDVIASPDNVVKPKSTYESVEVGETMKSTKKNEIASEDSEKVNP